MSIKCELAKNEETGYNINNGLLNINAIVKLKSIKPINEGGKNMITETKLVRFD